MPTMPERFIFSTSTDIQKGSGRNHDCFVVSAAVSDSRREPASQSLCLIIDDLQHIVSVFSQFAEQAGFGVEPIQLHAVGNGQVEADPFRLLMEQAEIVEGQLRR